MLRRTPFKPKRPTPHARAERILVPMVASPLFRTGQPVGCSAPAPKQGAIEHEGYRRLVAQGPCMWCSIQGYSQAAHPPPTGKGIKEDDRECFPLCCTRPGITGCHVEFDQYRLVPAQDMRAMAARWAEQTRASIISAGLWPKGLPMLGGSNA